MTSRPLVSIIMPAYNTAEFIAETIGTVRAQTYTNWELVIVDDGSTDNLKEVIGSLKLPVRQLQYFTSANKGPGAARNYAISKAKGDIIAFLDADDLWAPEKLDKQVEAMLTDQYDVVFSSGQFLGAPAGAVFTTAIGKFNGDEMFHELYQHNRIPIVSVVTKKKLVQAVGGFKEESLLARKCEDYDLWMRLARHGATFCGLEDKLVTYRIHANSAAGQTTTILEADIMAVSQYNDYVEQQDPKLYKDRMGQLYDRLAASYATDGQSAKARQALQHLKDYRSNLTVILKGLALRLLGKWYGKLYQRIVY